MTLYEHASFCIMYIQSVCKGRINSVNENAGYIKDPDNTIFFELYYFQQNEDKLFDLYILLFVFPSGEKFTSKPVICGVSQQFIPLVHLTLHGMRSRKCNLVGVVE